MILRIEIAKEWEIKTEEEEPGMGVISPLLGAGESGNIAKESTLFIE